MYKIGQWCNGSTSAGGAERLELQVTRAKAQDVIMQVCSTRKAYLNR